MLSIRKGLALILAATMLVVAGCGGSSTGKTEEQKPAEAPKAEAKKDPVKIQFWHGMADDSAHGKVLAQLIKEFNESQKDVIVEATYQGSYGDLEKKLFAALQANTPPHVVQNTDSMLIKLVDEKAVQAIDSYVPASERADYGKGLLDAQTFGDKLYALPFNKSMIVLIYDKTLVKNPPKNWEEFKSLAKELTIKDKRYGTAIEANVYTFGTHFAMTNGQWMNKERTQVLFNSPEGVEALTYIVDMIKEGIAIQLKPKEYQSNYFNEGRAAMIATTSASFAYIKPASGNEWGVAPLYSHKANGVPLSGANVAMVSGLKKEEADAAAKFMLWLTGKDATLKWAMGKTGYMPVRKSAVATAEWKSFIKENPIYGVFGEQMDRGVTQPNHPKWAAIQKEITTAVEKAILGQADPKTALDEAAKKANDILAGK
ncbi:MAG: ABC transporter substrate-binding protein [Bacillota bacterium]